MIKQFEKIQELTGIPVSIIQNIPIFNAKTGIEIISAIFAETGIDLYPMFKDAILRAQKLQDSHLFAISEKLPEFTFPEDDSDIASGIDITEAELE